MASKPPDVVDDSKEEHKRLARFVKGVHADLRKQFRANNGDLSKIWDDHCANHEVLVQYANAMHNLAREHWSKKPESRIDWCNDTAIEFFHQGGLKQVQEKDQRKKKFHCKDGETTRSENNSSSSEETMTIKSEDVDLTSFCYTGIKLPFSGKIRLLDVGSCYNPFEQFEEFLAIAIDISPAKESVYHCDFLHLETTDPLQLAPDTLESYVHNLRDPIERLPRNLFHVVVFSLLLEYFPSPYQRWLCCQKAHSLLMLHGLLLIVTPDSHQQHRNAPMIKSWRLAIENMGFLRWRYVKLDHIHCMAFRKVETAESDDCLVGDITPDMLYIPQDLSDTASPSPIFNPVLSFLEDSEDFGRQTLQELPFIPSDDDEGFL